MTFGENLKKARKEKGMTLQQVADAVGLGKSTIAGYENDTRSPDVFMIKKLAELLEVTGSYLIGYEEPDKPLSAAALRIARIYDNSNDKIKAAFDAVAAIIEG